MGQALTMDSIVVDWPYGNRTVHLDLEADVHHVLYESAEDPTEGIILGCTYTGACNYDELANSDDGSCDLSCFCRPGTYWEPLVQECLRICPSDINGDGAIGTRFDRIPRWIWHRVPLNILSLTTDWGEIPSKNIFRKKLSHGTSI